MSLQMGQLPAAGQTMPSGAPINIPTNTPVPMAANPNALQPLNVMQNNPFAIPTSTGMPVAGTIPSTVQSNGINWNDGSKTVTGDFKDTYGAGTGTAISNVLSTLGTSTDAAVQATLNNIQLQAGKQDANLQANLAASGISKNSSTSALTEGDFWSGVNAQEQQTISGMELNEEDTLLQTLLGEGSAHGTDASTWVSVMEGIGDASTIVGDITGAITGVGDLSSLFKKK